jgi:hypothetical protein
MYPPVFASEDSASFSFPNTPVDGKPLAPERKRLASKRKASKLLRARTGYLKCCRPKPFVQRNMCDPCRLMLERKNGSGVFNRRH